MKNPISFFEYAKRPVLAPPTEETHTVHTRGAIMTHHRDAVTVVTGQ